MVKVVSHAESKDVADAVANYIVKIQNETLAKKPVFNVAVSGGSLAKVLRNGLKDRTDVKWSQWHVFFADERIVPLDHEDSNYGLLKSELLDHLVVKPVVYTINPDLNSSEQVAQKYQKVIVDKLGPNAELNLVLLGCGPDGHTCSLFPGHPLLKEDKLLVAPIEDSPKPPPKRITLTFPVLKDADHIAFVAEGAGKAPVLKQIFEEPEKKLPSAIVNEIGKDVTWFVNNPAVEGVKL